MAFAKAYFKLLRWEGVYFPLFKSFKMTLARCFSAFFVKSYDFFSEFFQTPLFRVSLGLLLFRLLVLLSQGVPLVSLSWPKPFGGRDQWFARFLCGSASFFPSFVRQGFFSVLWTFFPVGQCVEYWAFPSFFPIVLLFVLPSLGLTDEKDFLFSSSRAFPLVS